MRKPILCLAFDGVLNSYTSGWRDVEVIPDDPVPGAKDFLCRAMEHFEVHVFSSRSHQAMGILAMYKWCLLHFGYDIANELSFPVFKPPAKVTIDDRGYTFTGEWPSIEALLSFKPWNKKGE